MIVVLFVIIAIGVACWYRRMHLMVNHPDKYERFHRAEKAFAKVQVAATERTARGVVAAIKAMARRLGRKFKKV